MPFFVLLSAAFLVMGAITWLERLRNPGPTDWVRNLQAYALDFIMAVLIYRMVPTWMGGSLLDAASLSLWISLPLFIILRDFTEWVYHLAQHKLPWLWAMHSLHHSDPEMSALTTNRHFWGDRVIKTMTIWAVPSMVIHPDGAVLATYSAISLYLFFVHANLKVDFGRWSWVLNSPAYHRRHHSRLPEHHDTNLAALFPIFDVIFGFYRRPDGWPPCGLDHDAPRSITDLLVWPVRGPLARLSRRSASAASVSEA